MEETRSVIDGTHPKPVGLEDGELERRRAKYAAPALGDLTYERKSGTDRFMMNQVDNISTRDSREEKVNHMIRLANRYDADAWGVGEHGINLQNKAPSETMASLFNTEVELRLVSSSSTYEKTKANHLPGGTAIVTTNTLGGCIKNTGADYRNLGRWSWMLLEGEVGYRTRVVQVYAVGNNK